MSKKLSLNLEKTERSEIEFPLRKELVYTYINPRRELLVWVSPDDFLDRAKPLPEPDRETVERYKMLIREKEFVQTPYLLFASSKDEETGRTVGHEGRHRMIASKELGIKQVPVRVNFGMADLYRNEFYPDNLQMVADKVWKVIGTERQEFYKKLVGLQKQVDRPPTFCKVEEGKMVCNVTKEKRGLI